MAYKYGTSLGPIELFILLVVCIQMDRLISAM